MKKITLIFMTFLFFILTAQIGLAQDAKEKNKQLLVNITRFLEENPFDEKAKKARENAFLFVTETKDVSVTICANDTFKVITKKKSKFGGELLIQYTLGMAAFKLENPAQKEDENAAQMAGLESMLKSYEVMVRENPKAQTKEMDELITKRDNGELKALVEKADCGKK